LLGFGGGGGAPNPKTPNPQSPIPTSGCYNNQNKTLKLKN
jgi:hypothetical protein